MNNIIINDAKPNGQTFAQSAAAYTAAGLSVLPTCADKRPALPWKKFTQRIITSAEIAAAEFPTIRVHRIKNHSEEQAAALSVEPGAESAASEQSERVKVQNPPRPSPQASMAKLSLANPVPMSCAKSASFWFVPSPTLSVARRRNETARQSLFSPESASTHSAHPLARPSGSHFVRRSPSRCFGAFRLR